MRTIHFLSAGWLAALLLLSGAMPSRSAPPLTDFGHGARTPIAIPILIVLGEFTGFPALTHDAEYYRRTVFNRNHYRSVNGFYWENSLGRFQWPSAGSGVIGPLQFPTSQTLWYGYMTNDPPYLSNIVHRAMTSGQFDFAPYDTDGDMVIEENELFIMFASNFGGGAKRATGAVKPAGSAYTVNTSMALIAEHGEFPTLVHELAHLIGAIDLYGQFNNSASNLRLTPMCATVIFTNYQDLWYNTNKWDSMETYHLDPWHKLQFGWSEPRLVSLSSGGVFQLPSAHMWRNDAAILLYEPGRTQEFFLLEYRNRTSWSGTGYDVDVGDNGVAIWHVVPQIPPGPYNEGSPTLVAGGDKLWKGEVLTPELRWSDGSSTLARVYVSPFSANDGSARVEVRVAHETWVDFKSTAPVEAGTFDWPFDTLAEGLSAVGWGGTLWFKTGSSSETAVISNPMVLRAYNGPVVMGER